MREGERVGPYVLGPPIAEGGMARVHRAQHAETGETVALKLPFVPRQDLTQEQYALLQREVQAMARLSHPHIVRVLEWGTSLSGQLYLAMPLIDDRSLRETARYIDDRGLLSIVDQLLDALAYVHDRGVVHRDVKARNLLIVQPTPADTPHLYLTDFGISTLDGAEAQSVSVGAPMGTPTYMSPEQLRGEGDYGATADLYAIGVLLYLMFQGKRPYAGSTVEQVLESRRRAPLPEFTESAIRKPPEGLLSIVHRLLDEDPLARYPSASSLRRALGELVPLGELVRKSGVCFECGEPLPQGQEACPICDEADTTAVESGSSGSVTAQGVREVIALAVAADASHRGRITSVLNRASAYLRWLDPTRAVALFGVREMKGQELMEAAEVGLSIASMTQARCGLARGRVRLSSGVIVELDAKDAEELAAGAAEGQVSVERDFGDLLGKSHRLETHEHALLLREPASAEGSRMSDARLEALMGVAATVQTREQARGVTLTAPPGSGRSFALSELSDRLTAHGWLCLRGEAQPSGRAEPFGVIRAAIRAWARIWPGADRASVAAELAARFVNAEVAAPLARLLTEGTEPELRLGHSASAIDAVGGLVGQFARSGPVLLSIDDLEYVDASTRELLTVLLSRHANAPVMVVVSAPEDAAPVRGTDPIALPSLEEPEARELLRSACDVGPADTDRLLALAEGNPKRLMELARLYQQRTKAGLTALPERASPEDVAHARVAALEPHERAVLTLAAVAGRTFWLGQLLAVADEAELDGKVGDALRTLTAAQLLERAATSSIPGTSELRFTQEAVYEIARRGVDADAAVGLHAKSARWLERNAGHLGVGLLSSIAERWDAAAEPRRAAAWDVRAARRAEQMGSLAEALERYEWALVRLGPMRGSLLPDGTPLPVDVPSVLAAIARLGVAVGELSTARDAAERALDVDEPPRALLRGRALMALAEVCRAEADPRGALEHLDGALAELGPMGDPILRAQAMARRGFVLGYLLGQDEAGRAAGNGALALLSKLDVPGIESQVYADLGAVELRAGRWERQLECNQLALELAKRGNELLVEATAHVNLAECFAQRGDLERAAVHAREGAEVSLRAGLHRTRVAGLQRLATIRLDQDAAGEAHRLLMSVMGLCAQHGLLEAVAETLTAMARASLGQRDFATTDARLKEAVDAARAAADSVGLAHAYRVQALALAARTELGAAYDAIERSAEALADHKDPYEHAVTRLVRAQLVSAGAEVPGALASLGELGADPALEARRWTVPQL